MCSNIPRVSIGMPVFNGENFLEAALDSLLGQTYTDFELIISDNASSDRTQQICESYAARDARIRYYRNATNLGAARNYNRVFALATGEYFKWAAHDDVCAPEFLQRCIEVLDSDPSIILCYTHAKTIDRDGNILQEYDPKPELTSPMAHERFYYCVNAHHKITHYPLWVFSVIRSDVLRKTRLIGNYASSDRVLAAELALLGRFYEIPTCLFYVRKHGQQSLQVYRTAHAVQAWFDPAKKNRITFPQWRLLIEHLVAVGQASLNWYERLWCYLYLLWWVRLRWKNLARNLVLRH